MRLADPGRAARALATVLAPALLFACGESSLLSPGLREGGGRIWEVSAQGFPSAFDLVSGRRLFLGTGDVSANLGDLFLDGPPASTDLRLRSLASLLRAEPAHSVGLRDLGAVDFEALDEVPDDGYTDSEDATGAAVVQGHVYAVRIGRTSLGDNFAKMVVDSIGITGGSVDQQFIDFRFVAQTQPGNRRFEED
jgi:hypothetical protein